ncbi:MAG TPA: hypothetical protein VNV88_06945 [Candidatus Solibacter sp.]|jgi:hypothetical protein|nr:hypothetical protein [Candidatus Solibacter sp.]
MKLPDRAPNAVLALLLITAVSGGALLVCWDLRTLQGLSRILDHLLAVVAILFGLIAVIYEWKLHRGFEKQKDDIKEIVQSIYTRYLGSWPDHLQDITKLVASAEKGDELLIFVDQIGYGHYSIPGEFREYLSKLEEVRNNGTVVRILMYPEDMARKNLEDQFPNDKYPDDQFKTASSTLKTYLDYYKNVTDKVPKTRNEFFTVALYIQDHLCARLTSAAGGEVPIEVHTINNPNPNLVSFWMIRRSQTVKEMIFAYPRFGGAHTGHGFATREPKLSEIFGHGFDEQWKKENSTKIAAGEHPFPKARNDIAVLSKNQ